MFEKSSILKLWQSIGPLLKHSVKAYLIGGGAMSIKGLKDATQDIDIVLTSHRELHELKSALNKLDYSIDNSLFREQVYRDAVIVFSDRTGSRMDVFVDSVCSQLKLSDSMKKRASNFVTFGNLNIYLLSNEDIFLFKSLSDREKDIADCRTLIETSLDWKIIINECTAQHRKKVKWIFWVYEQLCRIEDSEGIKISPKKDFFNICLQNWDKKPSDWMYGFSEEQIKRHISKKHRTEIIKSLGKYN